MTNTEEKILSLSATALGFLKEEEPNLHTQHMAGSYIKQIQQILLEKQKQKPLDANPVA